MPWLWLLGLAAVGYTQRSVPWILARQIGIPPAVVNWLIYVAPAAFATLLVTDVGRLSPAAVASLIAAAAISWRTRNLGLAVFGALFVGLLSQWLAIR